MTKAPLPLSQLTRADLEFLRRAIARRQVPMPLTQVALQSLGKGSLFARLGPLAGTGENAALALIDLALAAGDVQVALPTRAAAVPTWTIPDVTTLHTGVRATTPVVLEMLSAARDHVLIAGYEFDHGAVIFRPLYKAMVERSVKVAIYLDVRPMPSPRSNIDAHLVLHSHQFVKENWPFGTPFPELYYWPIGCAHGSRCSLHAKCVVVDARYVLVGSANFTRRGYKRNLEIGVSLDDPALAASLIQQFERLVDTGQLVQFPPIPDYDMPPMTAEDEEDATVAAVAPEASAATLAAELLVSEAARPLFGRLIANAFQIPLVGEDIEGENGEVIGSAEFVWDAPRVAVLLPEQEGSRKKLEAAGWTCFASTLDPRSFETLGELLKRGG